MFYSNWLQHDYRDLVSRISSCWFAGRARAVRKTERETKSDNLQVVKLKTILEEHCHSMRVIVFYISSEGCESTAVERSIHVLDGEGKAYLLTFPTDLTPL